MLLPEAFAVASISGLWRPLHWESRLSRVLYGAHTCLTLVLVTLLIVSQLMALILLTKSVEEIVEVAFLFLAVFNSSVKSVNMLFKRRKSLELLEMFDDWKCIPRTGEECKIRSHYDKLLRHMIQSTFTLGGLSAWSLGIWPLFLRGDDYILSIRAWQPYEITNDIRYYVTQIHQMIAIVSSTLWNATSDYIGPGFMIQICAQLQLMYRRLRHLPDDATQQSRLVKQSVQHHLHIFEISARLETAFTPPILSQYLLSSFMLCISLYQMTTNRTDVLQTIIMFVYVTTIMVELIVYCWYGNEVTETSLKFSEMICEVDWTKLDVSNRKGLLIIMLRSTRPLCITCGPLITLSNETYTRLLKTSYSVFNLLQRT